MASSEDSRTSLTEFEYQMGIERKETVIEYLLCVINVLGTFIYFSSFFTMPYQLGIIIPIITDQV